MEAKMKKIKIVELTGHEYYNEEYGGTINTICGFTDWDEVTDEEYLALQEWITENNKSYNNYTGSNNKIMMIEDKPVDMPKIVRDYTEKAVQQFAKKKEARKKQEQKDQKKQAAAQKKKEKLEKQKELEERALFEKLKTKYNGPHEQLNNPHRI
jgi:hypothetical protein